MGIYHFMGLGKSIGTVTCAVDYIEKALDTMNDTPNPETVKLFAGSGGIRHQEENRGKIEAIVLFTSKEVIDGSMPAFSYKNCQHPGAVHDEIVTNLSQIWRRYNHHEGQKIFWCEVEIDNYQDCFDKVIRATYRFSASDRQGKEIWCNLTGGTNSINLALLSMARLTGKSTKHYLLSQRKDYREEVTVPTAIQTICPNKDGYFHLVPFLKTDIDVQGFYEILLELERLNKSVLAEELLGCLKSRQLFLNTDVTTFEHRHLLKLYGLGYTAYDKDTKLCYITPTGQNFISEYLEPFLELEEELNLGSLDRVEESKKWEWFAVETL